MEGSLFRYARQIDWFHGRGYRQFEAILSRASHRSEYDNITTPGRLFEAWNQAGKPLAICNCAATARWYPGIQRSEIPSALEELTFGHLARLRTLQFLTGNLHSHSNQ